MKISTLAIGRRFRDAIPDGDRFRLRFLCGLEIQVQWDSGGPVVTGVAQGIITAETVLHPQFRYACGKTVQSVMTDGQQLMIHFTDGHCLRSSFTGSEPIVKAIDVNIKLAPPTAVFPPERSVVVDLGAHR